MDSLGFFLFFIIIYFRGTSKALMIACVTPSIVYYEETLSTMNYATRTMNIKNKPMI